MQSAKDTFDFILSQWNIDLIEFQEEAKIILLNGRNDVLGVYDLAKGGISSAIVDVRVIMSIALKCNATNLILVHNHPSGDLKPSKADEKITYQIKEAAELLHIRLLDHLIISKYDYYSFSL
ncbi:JAB domain-containing protein [Chryseobacterium nematophagum]|uniref:JAB domain-containing protein n=1 Tax=Chryseobacterium nematophagum TaxID=2305228 RepID=UPI001E3CEA3C|nr:JAB domain-containing protein [Chryseobacterium nematophagum]